MDSHGVILSIDDCLRISTGEGPRRRELLEICRQNLHLTGNQLFDAFRGHLDMVTLHRGRLSGASETSWEVPDAGRCAGFSSRTSASSL